MLRARQDAERTGAKLRSLGYEPLISPVLEIVATAAKAPQGAFDAVLATSAKGVELARFSFPLPLYALGARALEAAEARGWRAGAAAKDATALAALLIEIFPSPARFLYLAGRDRKDELEIRLGAAGHDVRVVETYEARAAATLSEAVLAALAAEDVYATLHYSRRSAEIFVRLTLGREDPALLVKLHNSKHFALSADVAAPLRRELAIEPAIAAAPDEDSLLDLLAR